VWLIWMCHPSVVGRGREEGTPSLEELLAKVEMRGFLLEVQFQATILYNFVIKIFFQS